MQEVNSSDLDPSSAPLHEAEEREVLGWIRQILHGDATARDRAFDLLFEKYRAPIYSLLFRMLHDREDALDATQEVFAKVLRGLDGFDPTARFFSWIYRIGINAGIDVIRYRRTRKTSRYPFGEEPGEDRRRREPTVLAILERREVRERLVEALELLPDAHRSVFLLYSQEGFSYAQIAEVLEIPIGTVMSRLYYARKKLAAALPPEWDPGGPPRRDRTGKEQNDEE